MQYESPMNSWKSISPLVVTALKLGASEPRRRLAGTGISGAIEDIQNLLLTYGAERCSWAILIRESFEDVDDKDLEEVRLTIDN